MPQVYLFGGGQADGSAAQKDLLGGKGANLAEMTNLGIPVPPGFTITTEVCMDYLARGYFPKSLKASVGKAMEHIETIMEQRFGDVHNPLLVSVRSGARQSMPGMMETVLNVGLTENTLPGLIAKTQNPRFVYDAYRRLIMMYADVVMEKAEGIEPEEGQGIRQQLEGILQAMKQERGITNDTDLTPEDLQKLVGAFKTRIQEVLGRSFPEDPQEQLWGGIQAVFKSWNGKRAVSYRRIEGIPDKWGTAVNVQAMVFGNMGDRSATGVAFTRNPATGENTFYGEWLVNAQGEDVVAGTRTPNPLNEEGKTPDTERLPSLETFMPKVYRQLVTIRDKLEGHYRDMQDIEFTIQEGRLWMLQTRVGKRNGVAAIRMAADMVREGLITKEEALLRVQPNHLDEIMHPLVDPAAERRNKPLAVGLPAGPGGACGQIVFTADAAETWAKEGRAVVLVRNETSPEDVHGMHAAAAILTAKGGMTSHAALVARGWGKCCIVGCSALSIDATKKKLSVQGQTLGEGDWLTLNGTTGRVYAGKLPLLDVQLGANEYYQEIMAYADEVRTLGVRTNADRPEDARQAREFGAEGIGLCRTEHMFFDPERIQAMREMIVARTEAERRQAVMKLLPFQRTDFKAILQAMAPYPVTIRLLDPPLHEFISLSEDQIDGLAEDLKVTPEELRARVEALHESNPMLGHRGCRLGIAYPEITEMQARAIFEATAELVAEGQKVRPEVMIPLVATRAELAHQRRIVDQVAQAVQEEQGVTFEYLVGTMIELPRACVAADEIAQEADFFSFGTNDLTQTTFGFSRDDVGSFLPSYLEEQILPRDPFQSLDQTGVGELVKLGVRKGRSGKPELKIGICGEHGGDPDSIHFFHRVGLDYVSCSPFRVPIARLAAAQAVLNNRV